MNDTARIDRLEQHLDTLQREHDALEKDHTQLARDHAITREAVRIYEELLKDVRLAQKKILDCQADMREDLVKRLSEQAQALSCHIIDEAKDRRRLFYGTMTAAASALLAALAAYVGGG